MAYSSNRCSDWKKVELGYVGVRRRWMDLIRRCYRMKSDENHVKEWQEIDVIGFREGGELVGDGDENGLETRYWSWVYQIGVPRNFPSRAEPSIVRSTRSDDRLSVHPEFYRY